LEGVLDQFWVGALRAQLGASSGFVRLRAFGTLVKRSTLVDMEVSSSFTASGRPLSEELSDRRLSFTGRWRRNWGVADLLGVDV